MCHLACSKHLKFQLLILFFKSQNLTSNIDDYCFSPVIILFFVVYAVFEFDPKFDNVVRVTKEDFQACNASSPFGTPSTGKEWFSLDVEGHVYFICSVPGHCKAGQNVEIVVHSAAPTTSPAASPPAILAPAPLSPHSSPDSAPSNGSVLHFPSFCLSLVLLLFSMFLVACCY